MARSTVSSSDLDLSLTGSQYSATKRPNSAGKTRPGSRPTSSSGRRPVSSRELNSSAGAGGDRKSTSGHKKAGSQNPRTTTRHNSVGSDSSDRHRNKPQRSASNDDFLALFDSSHQPVIKTTKKENRPSPNAVKVLWDPPSARAFPIPSSARSSSTADSSPLNSTRGQQASNSQHSQQLNSEREISNKRSPVSQSYTTTTNILRDSHNNLDNFNQNFVSSANKYTKSSVNNRPNNTQPNLSSSGNRPSSVSSQHSQNSVVEDYIATVNKAATVIQKAYREYADKKQMEGEDEIRKLLAKKKKEREKQMKDESDNMDSVFNVQKRQETDRKRIREERARQARQAAIEELQKKRQAKKEEIKQKAEKELTYLQASGKVTKKPSTGGAHARPRTGNASSGSGAKRKTNRTNLKLNIDTESESESLPSNRPVTASSVNRKVNEIFEESTVHNGSQVSTAVETQVTESTSAAQTKTTLNDLLATIKMLEEPEQLPETEKKEKPKPDWLEMLERDDNDEGLQNKKSAEVYLSTDKLDHFNSVAKSGKPSANTDSMAKYGKNALLTEDKLRSIMSFLDEVEKADNESESEDDDKAPDAATNPALIVPTAEELAKMEQASAAASEVTNTVLSQKLELEEKQRTVKMLQKALNQQRELTVRHAKEQDKEMKHRLHMQKDEYESTIKRHLSFIDQLIDDKKLLSDKYDTVVTELKQLDKKYHTRINKMEEDHSIEVKKIKDIHAAAEKIRREKWIDEKTKKIKEITVKGLEPEIQKLIAKHKGEVKKLKTIHDAELLQAEERAGQKYIKHIEELRDQLADEKEAACNRERENAKQRYEKQLEQEESAFQQQRRRMYAEIQDEKDRIAEQSRRQKQELDRLQLQMEDNNRKALDTMRSEYEKNRSEAERRHMTEVRDLEERLKVEKEAWEENYMKKQETWLLSKERELKENVRRDRDKEIELVIQRLEDDNISAREECERTAESRVKRIRDKYEAELREVERSERHTQERLNELKSKLANVEGENIRLRGLLSQKEQEVDDIKEDCDRLTRERKNVQDVVRQEFADRLVETDEENKRVKREMSEMRARHKLEIDRIQNEKEEEMAEVHARVRQAIVKKEETVSQLKQQHASAVKRADHLESLLEQQRKQLLQLKK